MAVIVSNRPASEIFSQVAVVTGDSGRLRRTVARQDEYAGERGIRYGSADGVAEGECGRTDDQRCRRVRDQQSHRNHRRRLVATVANPSANLWTAPILDRLAGERDEKPLAVPTVRALAPRFGGTSLYYLSSLSTGDGLWRFQDGQALEIWKAAEGALFEPPAVHADGRRVAVALRGQGKLRLQLVSADGSESQLLTDAVDVRGAASWSPDGKWIVTGGSDAKGPGLFMIPVGGGAPVRLAEMGLDPVWSPDGTLIVYTGANVGGFAPLLAMRPNGTSVELPAIRVSAEGERHRFLPDGRGLVYMQGLSMLQDFWLLDLTTKTTRQLTRLNNSAAMRTFDITSDGKQIVFDRLRENSDIVLIDLPK